MNRLGFLDERAMAAIHGFLVSFDLLAGGRKVPSRCVVSQAFATVITPRNVTGVQTTGEVMNHELEPKVMHRDPLQGLEVVDDDQRVVEIHVQAPKREVKLVAYHVGAKPLPVAPKAEELLCVVGEAGFPPPYPIYADDKVSARYRSRARRLENVLDRFAKAVAGTGLFDLGDERANLLRTAVQQAMKDLDRDLYGEELYVVERWTGLITRTP